MMPQSLIQFLACLSTLFVCLRYEIQFTLFTYEILRMAQNRTVYDFSLLIILTFVLYQWKWSASLYTRILNNKTKWHTQIFINLFTFSKIFRHNATIYRSSFWDVYKRNLLEVVISKANFVLFFKAHIMFFFFSVPLLFYILYRRTGVYYTFF